MFTYITCGFCPVAVGARTLVYMWFLFCCNGGKDSCLYVGSVLLQQGQGHLFTFGFCPVALAVGARTVINLFTLGFCPVAAGARTVVYIWFLSCCSGGKDGCLHVCDFCPVAVGVMTVVYIWFLSCCSGGKDSCGHLVSVLLQWRQGQLFQPAAVCGRGTPGCCPGQSQTKRQG